MYRVCTRFKEDLLGAGEGGDFHMKVDEIFVASLRIDHDENHYDMFTHRS